MDKTTDKPYLFQPGNKAACGHRKMPKDFRDMLEKAAPICLHALMDIVKNSKNDKVRVQAATAIWDRCYGRPGQAVKIDHNKPIDQNAIMTALADMSRGVMVDVTEDGVQRLLVSPSQQLPVVIPIEATEVTNTDDNS
ncbi:hypothetical protein [Synergistes jonesii]|uniref:hypothetical protein n=1 Tax=Synergistes jonesii TaxID=2754 RepID=UPI00331C9510